MSLTYNPSWSRDYGVTLATWRRMKQIATALWQNYIDECDEVDATELADAISVAVGHPEWQEEDISHPVYDLAAEYALRHAVDYVNDCLANQEVI